MIHSNYIDQILNINSDDEFQVAIEQASETQSTQNKLYKQFTTLVNRKWISQRSAVPVFLPISFFKTHKVINDGLTPKGFFESSGTTHQQPSKHYYSDLASYKSSFNNCFELFYGPANKLCIIALLPSYLERTNSSLIYMVDHLINKSEINNSGFYLDDFKDLPKLLMSISSSGFKIILFGVTYALLDLIEDHKIDLNGHIIMETGGMKGRRKEMIKSEVHTILKEGFNVENIHSEYGMTELFSQAYSKTSGLFQCPPWMRVTITSIHDPFSVVPFGTTGRINITDLANIHSCPFIATDDLGRGYPDGSFEVLGRMDDSELRGCNLMLY